MNDAILKRSFASVSAVSMMVALGVAMPAHAEGAAETESATAAGEIVVTARKREETLLQTPVTLSVLTSEELEKRAVVSVADLAANTPGFTINNNASGRADRSFQQIILRGFTPSGVLSTTTSMFIDGVAVASPSMLNSVGTPERVEVLKGPQSAYFGRNTFAGAINIVNKTPSDQWGGAITGMLGTRKNYRLRAEVEGPILGDLLTFRLTGDRWAKDGSWKNAYDGGTLGDQQSTSGTLLIVAKPTERLTIKAFGFYAEDKDGVAANTRLNAQNVTTAPNYLDSTGTLLLRGQSNCTLTGDVDGLPGGATIQLPYFCGVTPGLVNPVSSNTLKDSFIANFLASPRGRILSPSQGTQDYGLFRQSYHLHTTLDYELSDALSVSLLAGYNNEHWSQLSDLDGYDTTALGNPFGGPNSRSYFDFPFLVEREQLDHSFEGRVNYEFGRISGVVGASLLDAKVRSDLGGGNGALGISVFPTASGFDRAKTIGAFFGTTFEATDALSLSIEGRYQIDTLYAYVGPAGLTLNSSIYLPAGTYTADSLLTKRTYKNFLPRAIVNYQINPDLMVYASAAKGVNPGSFSTGIINQSATVQQAAKAAGITLSVDPEKVTNYEVGVKGRALGGKATFTLAGYYAKWRDQINQILVIVPDPTVLNPNNQTFVSGNANSGAVDLYGIEGDVALRVNDLIKLSAAGAINLSDIKRFSGRAVSQLTGVFDFSGKEQPLASKYSATAAVEFGGNIRGVEDGTWFARTDWNYKSGVWSNQANVVRTPDRHVVNFRTGVGKGKVSLELFVTNVFNNKNYTSIADNFTFTPTFGRTAYSSALLVGLPELRTAGVQMKVAF
ncbi:TonB-dependent receptor [Rhizorhabdus sp. FW153]|uniref:TonB-dependent receptor n=1 Tax=Rhizorhabdus sp. FW153 TaxID=3400216 RepID=UPI003CF6E575